jgi:hypothetical protein
VFFHGTGQAAHYISVLNSPCLELLGPGKQETLWEVFRWSPNEGEAEHHTEQLIIAHM